MRKSISASSAYFVAGKSRYHKAGTSNMMEGDPRSARFRMGINMLKKFGQLLEEKRIQAKLTIQELATISGISADRLEAFEKGSGDLPNFDMCYKLGQAISSRSGQMFVLQDLWQALRSDKLERTPTTELFFVN